jgi:hypothetical protein
MKKLLLTSGVLKGHLLPIFILLITSFFPFRGHAQKHYTAELSYAVKLGTTKPIHNISGILPADQQKLQDRKNNKPRVIPNFGGRRPLMEHNPNALPQGRDPLFQSTGNRMPTNDVLPLVNIEGIGQEASGSVPPDVNGEIGRDYYVEIVNATLFRVFDKSGNPVSGLISANSIWSQVGQTSAGDPILLYDQQVDRWFLTEFPSNNRVLVAISHTADPRGSWDAYAFQTPRFPDFPKYGIWPDAYYLTANESGNNFPIYAINREDILAGAPTARIQRLTVPKVGAVFFEVGQPADWDGLTAPPAGSPGIVLKLNDDDWGSADQDEILFHKVNIDWDNQANSNIEVTSIPTAPFDTDGCQLENTGGFSCIPQPNGQGIDGAQWIITNKAHYRNFGSHESLVMCFMVDVTGDDVAGIRWIEFRKTAAEDWHIYQEGTVGSDDGIHRFMPAIGLDGQGNIGLGYAVSGFDKFPSLRYTGRYSIDPPGEMTFTEFEFVSGTGSQGFDRFGDYFSMGVDPADESTFWFAGQYLKSSGNWGTRIVAFEAGRDTLDVFPVSLQAPANDGILGQQQVTFTMLNRGLTTAMEFPVGYQFNQGEWITETPDNDSLEVDNEYTYTFTTPVSFDAPGTYPLRIATLLLDDRKKQNDTLTFMITKYGLKDAALEYNLSQEQSIICDHEALVSMTLRNAGLDTMRQASFILFLAGNAVDTIDWTGELAFGEETTFDFLAAVAEGDNAFSIDVYLINESFSDDVPGNNQANWVITAYPDGEQAFLTLTTDNFPQETTWKLFDGNGTVIATGGPFAEQRTSYSEAFCLDPEACYTFTVFDAFGDGMSAQGVQGDFEIFNEEGVLIAQLARPNFGSQSSSEFCLTAQCLFSIEAGVTNASKEGANDGVVILENENSLGDVTYSIDGGINFQTSPMFTSLPAGEYEIIARDGAGCLDTITASIISCQLEMSVTTMPALGGDVGQIHIAVSGNFGPVTYSIGGGAFVTDSFFLMLEPGEYVVTSKDSAGCSVTDTVTVSTSVSTTETAATGFVSISPNPGKGRYQVEALLPDQIDVFVPYTIFNGAGEPILYGTLALYNNSYKGEISLRAYASGLYYFMLSTKKGMMVRRLIKVD